MTETMIAKSDDADFLRELIQDADDGYWDGLQEQKAA